MALLPGTQEKHRYQTCRDDDCPLPYCRIFKEGYAAGHAAGFAAGYAEGTADGYAQGYSDGQADAAE